MNLKERGAYTIDPGVIILGLNSILSVCGFESLLWYSKNEKKMVDCMKKMNCLVKQAFYF